jgi:NAD(P)-dependent dehydrogenase (short-subunit alcohol dehydrogenase family)
LFILASCTEPFIILKSKSSSSFKKKNIKKYSIMTSPVARSVASKLFDLTGKVAIVTGGGTGIGAGLAQGMAEAGAKVVLIGRRPDPLSDSAKIINDACGSEQAFALSADILKFDELPSLVAQAQAITGGSTPATILLNNAGINVRQKAEDLTPEHWTVSLDLMLTAPFFLARAMSDGFKSEKYGRVINIASPQSYLAFPDSIPYAAAKSGNLGMARAMAEYFAPFHGFENVTVNNISPGYVKTELTASVFADTERAEKLAQRTLLGRNSVPDDMVGTVVYLSSEASNYVTGQTIPVDGGFTSLGLR